MLLEAGLDPADEHAQLLGAIAREPPGPHVLGGGAGRPVSRLLDLRYRQTSQGAAEEAASALAADAARGGGLGKKQSPGRCFEHVFSLPSRDPPQL